MADHVVLIGMMGSGKTVVGRLVAERLGREFIDTDELIVDRVGRSIPDVFAEEGEDFFRTAEAAAVQRAVASPAAVIAVGGGAVMHAASRVELERAGRVIWLRASIETLIERVGSGHGRPLLAGDPAAVLGRLSSQRDATYAELADVVIDADGLSAERVAEAVVACVGGDAT